MHIYKITNKINGMVYIGQTSCKNPHERFIGHKKQAKFKGNTYIAKAIRKYGFENFVFTVLKSFPTGSMTKDQLIDEEIKTILKYNSLAPNGYNLRLRSFSGEMSARKMKKISKSIHRSNRERNKTNMFRGVYRYRKNTFRCEIKKGGRRYSALFYDEISAAEAYDMMAISLYNDKELYNFPNKKYTKEQVKKCREYFNKKDGRTGVTGHLGIVYDKSRDKYVSKYYERGKPVKYLGRFSSLSVAVKTQKDFEKKSLAKKLAKDGIEPNA